MRKFALICSFFCLCALQLQANDELQPLLPLLQAPTRTAAQTQQVLRLFTDATQPETVFAAGASLVRIPPAKIQENNLLNLLLKNHAPLKQFFAGVILTAMGADYPELSELMQEVLDSAGDPVLRAYAAAAYTVLNPTQTQYSDGIVHLYIYDPAFAQRAMNLISSGDGQTLRYLKKAAGSDQAQVRAAAAAWLGDVQNKKASAQLLRMADKETDTEVSAALAQALAKNQTWTLQKAVKKLNFAPAGQPAATYALALGFMTGNAVPHLKQTLLNKNAAARANAARAAAYMAGVLASEQARLYSSDVSFDTFLLKGLIPLLSALAQTGSEAEKLYAQNALTQIAKLK